MRDLTPNATAWLAGHHGVITSSTMRLCGVGRSTTERLIRAGVLSNPLKGVYVLAAVPLTLHSRCAILCAAHPTGFVTGSTAGALLPLRRMPRASGIHFAVRHGVNLPNEPGVVWRQTTALPKSHVEHRGDGINVAKPKRLAFDLAWELPAMDHLSVLHQLIQEKRVTVEELVAIGEELCHPARRGSGRFQESLERLGSGAPAGSHPEVLIGEALHDRGVPIERQSRVVRIGGRLARVDLAVPDVRWGVELDIHPEHRTLEGHGGDTRRYRDLHRAEWQIEPVSEADMRNVHALADELTELYQLRRRQFGRHPSVS